MSEENLSREFRLKKYGWNMELFNWRNKSKWIKNKKHKKVYRVLNYIEHLPILTSTVAGCVYVSRSAIWLETCVITTGIKKYKSIIKKKKKKHDKISSLEKSKLNSVEVVISKALLDSNIIHYEFVVEKIQKVKIQKL